LSAPSLAELRAVSQPESLLARRGEEHWAGRLYMRRLSIRLTRLLVPTAVTPNVLTALMVPAGLLAAFLVTFSSVWLALGAVLLIQVQLLLDCADGELARWRQTVSPRGVYLDQIAHYSTEAALPAALGVRADGGLHSLGGWTALGLGVSVLILFLKAETHLVLLARVRAGQPFSEPSEPAPREARRLRLRDGARFLPFFRPFHGIEASFLGLVTAIVDSLAGGHSATRALLVFLAATGVVAVLGHVTAVLVSRRLASPGAEATD
jgi:phosphatidylglycerophosphate synthase